MHKKIVILLSVLFFMGSNNPLIGAQVFNDFCTMPEFGVLRKVAVAAGIGAVLFVGNKATQLNEEYTKQNKRPDLKMRLYKAFGAMAVAVGTDILMGDTIDTRQNLMKIAAASISVFAMTNPAVANAAYHIPVVGGFLSDPRNKKDRERTDCGALWRGILAYMSLRTLGLKYLV